MEPGKIDTYKEDLKNLELTIKNSIAVSENLGDIPTTHRIIFVHNLFTKLLMNCMAINRLSPYNTILPISHTFWDFFSIATLTRSLFENYAVFHYMGLDNCTDEEWDFRYKTAIFHWNNEKYLLYQDLKAAEDSLDDFKTGLPESAAKLEEHSFFAKIPKDKQKKLLQGKVFMLKGYYEILKDIDFNDAPVAPLYRFYSNYTHSTGFSVMTMSNERGRGIENEAEVGYISYSLTFANLLLIRTTKEVLDILPSGKEKIPKEVLSYFNSEYKSLKEKK